MISHWMLYGLAAASLTGLAAVALERVLLSWGRPTRWIWAGALSLSPLLPLSAAFAPADGGTGGSVTVGSAWAAAMPGPGSALASGLERALGTGWMLMSAGILASLLLSRLWLAREKRRWRTDHLAGRSVWVSPDTGPAVFGLLRPEIVVPEWALRVGDVKEQRMILLHEDEHLRSGDPCLLAGALVALVLMPWNPAVWWQMRRLRLAVEVDCDRRVMEAGYPARDYGLLLLEIGRGARRPHFAAAALGARVSDLERRLRLIGAPAARLSAPSRSALLLAALSAVVLACEMPEPARPDLDAVLDRSGTEAPVTASAGTPQAQPRLIDPAAFARRLEAGYPPLLRGAGIGGTVLLRVHVGSDGVVQGAEVVGSSGRSELDAVAREALLAARFTPARENGRPLATRIQLPVTFRAE